MRRLIIAICLLIIIGTACVFSTMKLTQHVEDMINLINTADTYAVNKEYELWADTAYMVAVKWHEISVFIGSIARHNELDDIALKLQSYSFYAEYRDFERYMEHSTVLKAYLYHLVEAELPIIKNIF